MCFVLVGEVMADETAIRNVTGLPDDALSIDLSAARNALTIRYNAIADRVEISG
jgi:hypothetical protein